ncbi:hypothetical protein N8I77_011126 [Diaporthe amygdali]|uniref:Uncharacterized protein n=1 Tax=Phomopsis amygdali TaxID=1214568 RepID=A0AAD9S691_PHOAM|nr:hypothetical protein N8I77_011126 [Diaporthe amygdali]
MATTSSVSSNENLASASSSLSSSLDRVLTVTITRADAATSAIASTVSSETALITDSPNTVSSDLTLVYVFTKSATDSSSSSGSSTGSSPSGLSSGAIAGIVIGSVISLIFLVLLVFCTSRRFARKRRREEASLHHSDYRKSHAAPSSYHQARSQRSTIYSPKSPPQKPQELATHFNRLEVDGRGRPVEVLGSYKHPIELHGGSTTDLVAHVWKGGRRPAVRKDDGSVIYMIPARGGDDFISDAGNAVCLSPPCTWETESWAASVSGQSHISVSGTRGTPSKASSRDTLGYNTHTKE